MVLQSVVHMTNYRNNCVKNLKKRSERNSVKWERDLLLSERLVDSRSVSRLLLCSARSMAILMSSTHRSISEAQLDANGEKMRLYVGDDKVGFQLLICEYLQETSGCALNKTSKDFTDQTTRYRSIITPSRVFMYTWLPPQQTAAVQTR